MGPRCGRKSRHTPRSCSGAPTWNGGRRTGNVRVGRTLTCCALTGSARPASSQPTPARIPSLLVTDFVDRSICANFVAQGAADPETIAQRAMAEVNEDPEHSLPLALAAVEECAPTPAAQHALVAALSASRLRQCCAGMSMPSPPSTGHPMEPHRDVRWLDGTTRIWDPLTQAQLLIIRGHADEVRRWRGHQRTRLATVSADKTTRIWDAATGRQPISPARPSAGLLGSCLVLRVSRPTSSNDRTTKIWDAATQGARRCGVTKITKRGPPGLLTAGESLPVSSIPPPASGTRPPASSSWPAWDRAAFRGGAGRRTAAGSHPVPTTPRSGSGTPRRRGAFEA